MYGAKILNYAGKRKARRAKIIAHSAKVLLTKLVSFNNACIVAFLFVEKNEKSGQF